MPSRTTAARPRSGSPPPRAPPSPPAAPASPPAPAAARPARSRGPPGRRSAASPRSPTAPARARSAPTGSPGSARTWRRSRSGSAATRRGRAGSRGLSATPRCASARSARTSSGTRASRRAGPGSRPSSMRVPGGITSLGGSRHVTSSSWSSIGVPDLDDVAAEGSAWPRRRSRWRRASGVASCWKRGATARIRSSASRELRSSSYSPARSSACPPRSAAMRATVRTSGVIASGSTNGKPIEPASRSPTKTGTPSAPDAYGASGGLSGNRADSSCRRCAQAGFPSRAAVVIGARVVSGSRVPGRQRQPVRTARVDDHELVALDEAERPARGADRRRHALDHRGRHLLDGERRRERRGKRLQPLDADAASAPRLPRRRARPAPVRAGSHSPTPAINRPLASDAAQRRRSSDDSNRSENRGSLNAHAARAQPEMIEAMAPSTPTAHTATATAPRRGA